MTVRNGKTIGSSPCVWGQVSKTGTVVNDGRIIPMRVGTSSTVRSSRQALRDHPHACGDKFLLATHGQQTRGSSPCVWGQDAPFVCMVVDKRIIPMRVGTRFDALSDKMSAEDHPHACGDKRLNAFLIFWGEGSSPCVWGQGRE